VLSAGVVSGAAVSSAVPPVVVAIVVVAVAVPPVAVGYIVEDASAGSGYQAGGCELVCAGVTGTGGSVDVVVAAPVVAFSTECCQRERLGTIG
jgi:hypothetical protein